MLAVKRWTLVGRMQQPLDKAGDLSSFNDAPTKAMSGLLMFKIVLMKKGGIVRNS
jgi:hypothetical protein